MKYENGLPIKYNGGRKESGTTGDWPSGKKEFDYKYKKTWHCIVGENFGSFVTHESKTFIFFQIADVSVLLFKSAKID